MGQCPECDSHYPPAVVACPRCRVVLEPVHARDDDVAEVVHRVPDAVAGALLCGILEHHGSPVLRRDAGYGPRRDWSTSAWERSWGRSCGGGAGHPRRLPANWPKVGGVRRRRRGVRALNGT
jgi:hypothetical protein